MYEVETKVRADHEAIREFVGALGAEFRGTIEQEDTYYDAPHRSLGETDEALRVRRETIVETAGDAETGGHDGPGEAPENDDEERNTERTVLTYKGPLVDGESKTRREVETVVENATAIRELLLALGFESAAAVSKTRSIYAAAEGEWTLVCDRVEGLGEFVEVELEAEAEDIDAARERVRRVLRDLDVDPEAGIRASYLEMLLDEDDRA
ncbi:class IV adenylate cyclase [Halobacteriales archaeon QS_3_64_16]|nr:MAG: class IV adenylate cyclase [Halobacteriales archaeon QS_3_64_16]